MIYCADYCYKQHYQLICLIEQAVSNTVSFALTFHLLRILLHLKDYTWLIELNKMWNEQLMINKD